MAGGIDPAGGATSRIWVCKQVFGDRIPMFGSTIPGITGARQAANKMAKAYRLHKIGVQVGKFLRDRDKISCISMVFRPLTIHLRKRTGYWGQQRG